MRRRTILRSRHLVQPGRPRRVPLLLLVICCVAALLASCSFQPGGDLLAFMKDGGLYVASSDGSGLREIASGSIVDAAWSPDHHQIVFRAGKNAVTVAAAIQPEETRGVPDTVSDLYISSVSGGSPLRITPDATAFARSDAWWNPNGNRLLYREEYDAPTTVPVYIVSQADQPVGIARKAVADIVSIPVLSPDGSQVAGIDAAGNLRIGTPGQSGRILATGLLRTYPGTNRPARVLWQPHAQAVLYPTAGAGAATLVLRDLQGDVRAIGAFPELIDMAFSPDGKHLLIRTPEDFQLWSLAGKAQSVWHIAAADPLALPWWSPDGSKLLLQDNSGWHLVDAATGKMTTLLATTPGPQFQITPSTRWHPAAGSPWSPDGTHIVFASSGQGKWLGRTLPDAKGAAGIYVARIGGAAPGGQPTLLADGNVRAPTWSYLDPSAVFLVTA